MTTLEKQFRERYRELDDLNREAVRKSLEYASEYKEERAKIQSDANAPVARDGKLPPNRFPADKVARLRSLLVRDIWEPDLRAELVDRCVRLVASGVCNGTELKKAIAHAKEKKRAFEESDGKRGSDSLWKPLGVWCKGKYEAAGVAWSKTDKRLEPQPRDDAPRQEREEEDPRPTRAPGDYLEEIRRQRMREAGGSRTALPTNPFKQIENRS